MPPDDPTSHRLMHCVDCKPGWPCWGQWGCAHQVDSPYWQTYLPRDERGAVILDRQSAVELSLIHSREYQQELEDLYLSALDVTFERFRFDVQFFGGLPNQSTFFTAEGPDRTGTGQSSSVLELDHNLQLEKTFATGGQLVVELANSLVWQFSGPNDYAGLTILDFSLVQPLLRAGGRAVVLEELTQSERALLANVRQMERFRRGFYTQVIAGRNPGTGPSPAGIALSLISAGQFGVGGGLYGLLEQQVRIRNQRTNVALLRSSLAQLEALELAGRIERYQVYRARQGLYEAQSTLLQILTSYQRDLDDYKISLGLPPNLDAEVHDPLLDQFYLIDPTMTAAQDRLEAVLTRIRMAGNEPQQMPDAAEVRQCVAACSHELEAVSHDVERLLVNLPARRESLRQLAQRAEVQRGDVERSVCDVAELDQRVEDVREQYATLSARIKATIEAVEQLLRQWPKAGEELRAFRDTLQQRFQRLEIDLADLSLVQAAARLDAAILVPVDLPPQEAIQIARQNRRDWMNARAALVDVWRQIEVAANDLMSGLDVTFSGDLRTTDENPIRFRGTAGSLSVGLEFDAPLNRLAERNVYRETLIEFQRARRAFMALEDQIYRGLRDELRTIRQDQLDFEIRREAVRVAISQVEQSQARLRRPPKPEEIRVPGQGGGLGDTLARDLVQDLASLLRAQNDFASLWVQYEALRINLDLDLGTMRIDSQGQWLDPGPIRPSASGPKQPPSPPAGPLIEEFLPPQLL